jgi:hypothetical protein
MPSDSPILRESTASTSVLGILWTVYGAIRLGMTLWLVIFSPTATVMFGALLPRVADPFTLMSAFHFFYVTVILWSALCGAFALLAGLGLLAGQRAARSLALIAAFLSVSELPLGATLGIYTLILFLPRSSASSHVVPRQAAA